MRWLCFAVIVVSWAYAERRQAVRPPITLSPPSYLVKDVEAAMTIWNERCPGMFRLGVGGVTFEMRPSLPNGHIGEYWSYKKQILLTYVTTELLAHEIGHAAGARDLQTQGIMRWESSIGATLDGDDILEMRRYGWKCESP